MQNKKLRWGIALVWLAVAGRGVLGQEAAPLASPVHVGDVNRWIDRLTHGSSEEQKTAESRLVEMGPEVMDQLPPITENMSELLRARLMRIRVQLQKQVAAQLAEPTHVSLNGKMKLSEALAAIQQQTGNRIIDNREAYANQADDPEIETDLESAPFWQAVETLLDRAGMVVDPNVLEPRTLGFTRLEEGVTSPIQRARSFGRFRFEPLRTESFRNLRQPSDRFLRLGLEISWEPISAPVALIYRPDTMVATDENGESLKLTGPDEPTEIPVLETGSAVEIDLPFELSDSKSLKIAKLSGSLDAMIPGQYATFEFSDLAAQKAQTQSRGGVTVTLQRARKSQGLVDIWILVQILGADELLKSHRGWVYNNPAQLIAADGSAQDYVGMDTFRQTETDFGISYKYDVPGELDGFKFRYRTPAAILSVPVDFQLSDIRLP